MISPTELSKKITEAAKKHPSYDMAESFRPFLKELTPKVESDLNKVDFDTENLEYEEDEGYANGKVGFRTLSNGLSILGVTSGGDWESPLYFILYFDGKELRGYIPTEGNVWNTDTYTAYGNNEEADEINCKKRFGVNDYNQINLDQDKIDADIQARIVLDGACRKELTKINKRLARAKLPNKGKVSQPKIDGELAFTATELVKRCSGSAKGDSKALYRILKEVCIERNDFESAAQFREKERNAE
jgi:hypothetical protein